MERQSGEQSSSNGQGKRRKEGEAEAEAFSSTTKETIAKIKRNRTRSSTTDPLCTIHDNKSPGYGWLLPGWVAEERHMDSGRTYRYYYDPEGRLYNSQTEVIAAWEKAGMVVIDK